MLCFRMLVFGFCLLPLVALAKPDCDNPTIHNQEDLLSHALACNGQQQSLDAHWRAQQHRSESAGRLKDPKLILSIAPESYADESIRNAYIAELTQPLPWPGVLSLQKQLSAAEANVWQARLRQGEVHLARAIRFTFAQWHLHRQLLIINQQHQDLWETFIDVVRSKYVAGTSSKSAVLQAKHAHHLLLEEAIEFKAMIKRDRSELRRLTNLGSDTRIDIVGELPVTQLPQDHWQALLAHLELQPQMLGVTAEQQKKAHELALVKKDRYPSFDLMARYNGLWMNEEQRWVVGVGANLPLDFGNRQSHEDSVRAEQMALQWQQQDLRVQLREHLLQRYSHWQQAKEVYELYQSDLLPLAEESLISSRDEYQSGSGDFLSLLTAQRQLLFTQGKAQKAFHDQFTQFAELLAAAGMVFESELGVSYEKSMESFSHE